MVEADGIERRHLFMVEGAVMKIIRPVWPPVRVVSHSQVARLAQEVSACCTHQ